MAFDSRLRLFWYHLVNGIFGKINFFISIELFINLHYLLKITNLKKEKEKEKRRHTAVCESVCNVNVTETT